MGRKNRSLRPCPWIALFALLPACGCLSIVARPPTHGVLVTSDPPGAVVRVLPGGDEFETPARLELLRKNNYLLRIRKPCFFESRREIRNSTPTPALISLNLLAFGILFGVPGILIDVYSGSALELDTEHVQVALEASTSCGPENEERPPRPSSLALLRACADCDFDGPGWNDSPAWSTEGQAPPGMARVVLVNGPHGGSRLFGHDRVMVYVDQAPAARLHKFEYATLLLPVGLHEIRVDHVALARFSSGHLVEIQPGTNWLRVYSTTSGNHVNPIPDAPDRFARDFAPGRVWAEPTLDEADEWSDWDDDWDAF